MQALRFPKEYKVLTVLLQSDPKRAPFGPSARIRVLSVECRKSSGRHRGWFPCPGRQAGVKCQCFAAFQAGKAFQAPAHHCDLDPKHSVGGLQKPSELKATVLADGKVPRAVIIGQDRCLDILISHQSTSCKGQARHAGLFLPWLALK